MAAMTDRAIIRSMTVAAHGRKLAPLTEAAINNNTSAIGVANIAVTIQAVVA